MKSILDGIERGFLFRFARAVQLLMVALATLGAVVGLVIYATSFVPVRRPPNPPGVAVQPVPVLPQDVAAVVEAARIRQQQAEQDRASRATAPAGSGLTARERFDPPPEAIELARLIDSVRQVFDERGNAWLSVAGPAVLQALARYNAGNMSFEAEIDGDVYLVNISGFAEKRLALQELLPIVRASPPEQEVAYLNAWRSLRRDRELTHETDLRNRENQRASEIAAIENRYEAERGKRLTIRKLAVAGAPWIAGSLVVLGLSLSLLAIERSTRRLQQAAEGLAGNRAATQ